LATPPTAGSLIKIKNEGVVLTVDEVVTMSDGPEAFEWKPGIKPAAIHIPFAPEDESALAKAIEHKWKVVTEDEQPEVEAEVPAPTKANGPAKSRR
jgi:hypothetical protein